MYRPYLNLLLIGCSFLILNGCGPKVTVVVEDDRLLLDTDFAPPSPVGFIKGHSWGFPGNRGSFGKIAAKESIQALKATNADWICICYSIDMPAHTTPELAYGDDNQYRVTDAELKEIIRYAQSQELDVILKPMITCRDWEWRAKIDFFKDDETRDSAAWEHWWQHYQDCLVHYGKMAEETGCKMFCLGCEMVSTEEFDAEWRESIGKVRDVYNGLLTYDVNFTVDEFPAWLEDLDLISLSAYYHIGVEDVRIMKNGHEEVDWQSRETVDAKAEYLDKLIAKVQAQCERFNLPILFIETGVCSAQNASRHPWRHPNEVEQVYDGQEQADFYEAFFQTMWDKPWFVGFCWWDWPPELYSKEDASEKINFAIYGKPAEEVVTNWYTKPVSREGAASQPESANE